MNPSSPNASNGRSCLRPVPGLVVLFACIGLGVFLFTFATSTASAAFFETPTPTQENLWAPMNLPKPTQTATAVPAPTEIPSSTPEPAPTEPTPTELASTEPTPTPAVTETTGGLSMQIVENPAASDISPDAPAPAPSYGGSKYILVDISEQHMYVYDGDTLVYSFVASTGMNNATRVGTFAPHARRPRVLGPSAQDRASTSQVGLP